MAVDVIDGRIASHVAFQIGIPRLPIENVIDRLNTLKVFMKVNDILSPE